MIRLEVEPYDLTAYTYVNQAPCCVCAATTRTPPPRPPAALLLLPLPARLPLTPPPLSASPQADADYDASSNPYPPSRLGMLLSGTGFRQKRDISRVNEKNFRNLEITPCGATYCEVLEDVGGKDEYVRYPPCKGCKRYDGAKKAIYGANVLAHASATRSTA